MNLSLLAKWRWKLLSEGDEMWRRVVVSKYGGGVVGNANLNVEDSRYGMSVWWRDICRLDVGVGWFNQVTMKKLGNGSTTRFGNDVWVEDQSLEM
jgi:hypothetical protein